MLNSHACHQSSWEFALFLRGDHDNSVAQPGSGGRESRGGNRLCLIHPADRRYGPVIASMPPGTRYVGTLSRRTSAGRTPANVAAAISRPVSPIIQVCDGSKPKSCCALFNSPGRGLRQSHASTSVCGQTYIRSISPPAACTSRSMKS
jgi:hypothetical protein